MGKQDIFVLEISKDKDES